MGRTWGRGLWNPSCGSFCGCRQALSQCPFLAQARVPFVLEEESYPGGTMGHTVRMSCSTWHLRAQQHPPAATALPPLPHPAASPTARPAAPPLIFKNAFISLFGRKGHPSLATHYFGTMEMAAAGPDPGAGIGSCGRVSGAGGVAQRESFPRAVQGMAGGPQCAFGLLFVCFVSVCVCAVCVSPAVIGRKRSI